jgi:imidazoleglycerol-phosphate dehydratase
VIDISSRPWAEVALGFTREKIGEISTEMLEHALVSFAMAARLTLHVDVLRGKNNHHKAEAAFKSVGVALRAAVARDGGAGVPSTKGVLA